MKQRKGPFFCMLQYLMYTGLIGFVVLFGIALVVCKADPSPHVALTSAVAAFGLLGVGSGLLIVKIYGYPEQVKYDPSKSSSGNRLGGITNSLRGQPNDLADLLLKLGFEVSIDRYDSGSQPLVTGSGVYKGHQMTVNLEPRDIWHQHRHGSELHMFVSLCAYVGFRAKPPIIEIRKDEHGPGGELSQIQVSEPFLTGFVVQAESAAQALAVIQRCKEPLEHILPACAGIRIAPTDETDADEFREAGALLCYERDWRNPAEKTLSDVGKVLPAIKQMSDMTCEHQMTDNAIARQENGKYDYLPALLDDLVALCEAIEIGPQTESPA